MRLRCNSVADATAAGRRLRVRRSLRAACTRTRVVQYEYGWRLGLPQSVWLGLLLPALAHDDTTTVFFQYQ
jgi:hypothetical protein